jgi:hypothetical protein
MNESNNQDSRPKEGDHLKSSTLRSLMLLIA